MDKLARQLMEVALRCELGREATPEEIEAGYLKYHEERALQLDKMEPFTCSFYDPDYPEWVGKVNGQDVWLSHDPIKEVKYDQER